MNVERYAPGGGSSLVGDVGDDVVEEHAAISKAQTMRGAGKRIDPRRTTAATHTSLLSVIDMPPSVKAEANHENVKRAEKGLELEIPTNPTRVTELLLEWGRGDEGALERLIPLVHRELHGIARRCMAGERAGHSLQATVLVSEAYLRLVQGTDVKWQDRAHFLAVAARVMRRILVDHARGRRAQKRGGPATRVTFDEALLVTTEPREDFVALDDALEALAEFDQRKSRVVELRFFGGLTVEETASVLKVSPETVMRDWQLAKSWLQREMRGGRAHDH
ncbi:MAG: sigma-70 family RNA polymerase sigma factor [Vicinamibacterales bacterium]